MKVKTIRHFIKHAVFPKGKDMSGKNYITTRKQYG